MQKNFWKKLITAGIVLAAAVSMVGCAKKKPQGLNAERGTNYKFDFVNYLDFSLYGTEGNGFVEVKPKDISVDDFDTEDDYIAVKKVLDAMSLYLIPGNPDGVTSYLDVEPNTGLKNGDVITFSIKDSFKADLSSISFNTEPFQYQVSGLPDPTSLNLFDETSVTFYGLSGTKEVYALKKDNGNIPSDILKHLEYTIVPDGDTLKQSKTILEVTADMDKDFLTTGDDPCYTIDVFLGKRGYAAETKAEKVLMNVVDPIDFTKISPDAVATALYTFLNGQELKRGDESYTLSNIASIQQVKATEGSYDPYSYYITYYVESKGDRILLRSSVRMVEVAGTIQILTPQTTLTAEHTDDKYATQAYENATLIYSFVTDPSQIAEDPTASADTITDDVTVTPTPSIDASAEPTASASASAN
jgi:hypothetical protein